MTKKHFFVGKKIFNIFEKNFMKNKFKIYTSLSLILLAFIAIIGCKTHKNTTDSNEAGNINLVTAQDYFKLGSEQLDKKNYDDALKMLNKAVERDSTNGNNYAYRGMAKYYLKDFKGAINDYDKAIKLIPDYGEVYDLRGVAKGELLDKVGACEDWNKAFELGFNKAFNLIQKYCVDSLRTK
jgi:tetratricopeptide (TPR) repeat protein